MPLSLEEFADKENECILYENRFSAVWILYKRNAINYINLVKYIANATFKSQGTRTSILILVSGRGITNIRHYSILIVL